MLFQMRTKIKNLNFHECFIYWGHPRCSHGCSLKQGENMDHDGLSIFIIVFCVLCVFSDFLWLFRRIRIHIRMCIEKKKREKRHWRSFGWRIFKKKFAGDLRVPLCENFTIYSVFHALSNDLTFINSARDQKFRTSWYNFLFHAASVNVVLGLFFMFIWINSPWTISKFYFFRICYMHTSKHFIFHFLG